MQINNDIISNTMRHLFATTDNVVLDRSARLQSTGISATDLVTDMFTAIRALPDKQSSNNPLPTRLLQDNANILSPFLVEFYNCSFRTG